MSRRYRWSGVVLAGVLLALRPTPGQPPKSVADFMRPKLAYAQQVLEGLTLEEFEQVATAAQALTKLSQAADFQVLPDPEYVRHATKFQRTANELAVAAGKRNIEGATFAYVQLTMQCIDCHQHIRRQQSVKSGKK